MKKIIKKGLLSVALLATVVLNASELKEVKVSVSTVSEVKKLDVILSGVVSGETLTITNAENGVVVYNERLTTPGVFAISLDFSKFNNGIYNLKSVLGDVTKVTPIIVSPKTSTVIKGETKLYIAPKIIIENSVADISIANEGLNPVTVIIYGGSHELDIIKNVTNSKINLKYDLSRLSSGTYSIIVIEGEKIFEEEIKI